jgi:hypothetical protein
MMDNVEVGNNILSCSLLALLVVGGRYILLALQCH